MNTSDNTIDGVSAVSASGWRKYRVYDLCIDPDQDDKAKEIKLCSLARPHMRAFHCSWWSFFVAFFMLFAISPLLSEIQETLGISTSEVWTSSIASALGTMFIRFLLGPLCDKFGARILMALILCLSAIPTACTGFIETATDLAIIRLFIGMAGGTFVMCQFWTTSMFTKEIVGTANALVGGWGNLSAGVTQIVMGSVLFPLFKLIFDGDTEKAWRTVCVIPAVIAICTGVLMYRVSDDTPKGNYGEMKKHEIMPKISSVASFRRGAIDMNTWLLFIQYGCCFGVEFAMDTAAALYFKEEFGQSTESAAAIASIFTWLLLFSRGLGGFISDAANARHGMRGRIVVQTVFLFCEGGFVLLFGQTKSMAGAICCMVVFSLFVQAATGSTYGIVPYVNPSCSGTVIGIVGAGGSAGGVCFGITFRQFGHKRAFLIMGLAAIGSGLLSLFIDIKGHSTLFREDQVLLLEDQQAEEEAPAKPQHSTTRRVSFPVEIGIDNSI